MKTEKAKMLFAGVKQVRRYDDIDFIKAEYATVQTSVMVFHPVTHQLALDDSSKFSQIDGAERFHNSLSGVELTSLHLWLMLVAKINI